MGRGCGERWAGPVPWNLGSLIDKAPGPQEALPEPGPQWQSGQPGVERVHLKD